MIDKTIELFSIDKLKMPTKIYIGDLEVLDSNENIDYNFSKNFKCKSKWVGEAHLKSVKITSNDTSNPANYLTLFYAPTEKLLNIYKNKSIFDSQKFKNTEVLTASKNAIVQLNNKSLNLSFDNEGLFADVLEIFNKTNKLEGLIITIYLGNNKFNSLKKQIKNLL